MNRMAAILKRTKIYYGWYVLAGSALVVFGVLGIQFSFGVFLKPMTEEFGWSRTTLSLAFGITFILSGLLRPLAGYLADRYSAKWAALSGVIVLGVMLLVLPLVSNLLQLFIVFSMMSIGLTMGTGAPILIKVVSAWFLSRRGLTLGLVSGAGSVGAMILVPGASVFLVLFDWREAYIFLGLLLLVVILPVGILLIRDRPEDGGLLPQGQPGEPKGKGGPAPDSGSLFGRDATFREAVRTPLFQRLTIGYFV